MMKNAQSVYMPQMMEMQKKFMDKIVESGEFEKDSLSFTYDSDTEKLKNVTESMQEIFALSEFSKKWIVRFGILGILIAMVYILSGVFLLVKRSFSINSRQAPLKRLPSSASPIATALLLEEDSSVISLEAKLAPPTPSLPVSPPI